MVLDYSKWDALELSDDSDIEVHPNVDKRSFIRAKQNQIHQERFQRKHEIDTLKYERLVNDSLLSRIDKLISALEAHRSSSANPEGLVFQALYESAGDFAGEDDQLPPRPAGVHSAVEEQPTFSKMIATLVDCVKKEVDEAGPPADKRYAAYITAVRGHHQKVGDLQAELQLKLDELEKLESRKITSESIHTGFDSSRVSKEPPKKLSSPTSTSATSGKTVEVLNPAALSKSPLNRTISTDSGADADVEEEAGGSDDEAHQPSALGKRFAKIKLGDYRTCLQFISEHPAVVAERETDGLLAEAFSSAMDGKEAYAKQCVHQALLLQYCRSLGRDGVGLFFKRITTPGHQAAQVFTEDVTATWNRIRIRAGELAEEAKNRSSQDVEQIQLHAVDPNQTINIVIPPSNSDCTTQDEREAREVFETFPPGLQKALESGKLEEVNKILGKMSVEEAEEVVGKLGEGGMLSMEEGVIDATNDEGREILRKMEQDGVHEDGEPQVEIREAIEKDLKRSKPETSSDPE